MPDGRSGPCATGSDRPTSRAAYRAAVAAQKGNLTRTADLARRNADAAAQRIQSRKIAIFDGYLAFHMHFGPKSELTRERAHVVRDVEPWVEQGIKRIDEVDLVRHEAEAQAAAKPQEHPGSYTTPGDTTCASVSSRCGSARQRR